MIDGSIKSCSNHTKYGDNPASIHIPDTPLVGITDTRNRRGRPEKQNGDEKMQKITKIERMEIIGGLLDMMENISYQETYRQLTEVIETQASVIERVTANENSVSDLEDAIETNNRLIKESHGENLIETIDERISAIENCPEQDRKIAQLEGQVHTLTEKVQGLIEILSSVCNLE